MEKTLFQGERSGSLGNQAAQATDKGKVIRVSDIKAFKNQGTGASPPPEQAAPEQLPLDPWTLLDSADRQEVIKMIQDKL